MSGGSQQTAKSLRFDQVATSAGERCQRRTALVLYCFMRNAYLGIHLTFFLDWVTVSKFNIRKSPLTEIALVQHVLVVLDCDVIGQDKLLDTTLGGCDIENRGMGPNMRMLTLILVAFGCLSASLPVWIIRAVIPISTWSESLDIE